ncbi:hypothetical protein QR680_005882 [Steinernema hermaphroditum]|uniref:SLED domain-containing protein n=1 Tax=Steinernema hermaphroditum TaxID=289476 RepID=A0AA39LVN2_9BILA|nr:hypothetical protein QR680_005882 [Steinernema hermaphroditum]
MASTSRPVTRSRWNAFMNSTALLPADDAALFRHLRFLEKTVAERCLRPGTVTAVQTGDGKWIRVKVETVCGRRVLAGEINNDHIIDWFPLERCCFPEKVPMEAETPVPVAYSPTPSSSIQSHDEVASSSTVEADVEPEIEGIEEEGEFIDGEGEGMEGMPKVYKIKAQLKVDPVEAKQWDFLVNTSSAHFQQIASKKLIDLIEVEHYFEIQSRFDPMAVHIACIRRNNGGYLQVLCPGTNYTENIFVTNERCHKIGWCASQECPGTKLCPEAEPWMEQAKLRAVPDVVFEFVKVGNHRFEKGMMVELLDWKGRLNFYPGYISKVVNDHYFMVAMVKDMENSTLAYANRKSYFLLPCGFCQRNNLRLTKPAGFGKGEFSWSEFRSRLNLTMCAPEQCFSLPKIQKPIEKMRHLEMISSLGNGRALCYPFSIVRTLKHLIWLHNDTDPVANPPFIYTSQSEVLFPCGFCENNDLSLAEIYKFPTLLSMTEKRNNGDRYRLQQSFSSMRTPIFMTTKKSFLPEVWMHRDLWVPALQLNKGCYQGPFLNPNKIRYLRAHYGPGPMPVLIKQLFADIVASAYRPAFVASLLRQNREPRGKTLEIKSRPRQKQQLRSTRCPFRFRIEVCEKVTEFAGWLRYMLIQLDACPHFIGPSFTDPFLCPAQCARTRQLPMMQPEGHVNIVPAVGLVPAAANAILANPAGFGVRRRHRRGRPPGALYRRDRQRDGGAPQHPVANANLQNGREEIEGEEMEEEVEDEDSELSSESDDEEEEHPEVPGPAEAQEAESDFRNYSPPDDQSIDMDSSSSSSDSSSSDSDLGDIPPDSPVHSNASFHAAELMLNGVVEDPHDDVMPIGDHPDVPIPAQSSSEESMEDEEEQEDEEEGDLSEAGTSGGESGVVDGLALEYNNIVQPVEREKPLSVADAVASAFQSPRAWSKEELRDFLNTTECASVAEILYDEEVDGEAFMLLKMEDFVDTLHLRLGPSLKLKEMIRKFEDRFNRPPSPEPVLETDSEEDMHRLPNGHNGFKSNGY